MVLDIGFVGDSVADWFGSLGPLPFADADTPLEEVRGEAAALTAGFRDHICAGTAEAGLDGPRDGNISSESIFKGTAGLCFPRADCEAPAEAPLSNIPEL